MRSNRGPMLAVAAPPSTGTPEDTSSSPSARAASASTDRPCRSCRRKRTQEQHENYVKQSYRNRCHVLTAQGVVPLSIPVLRGNSKDKTRITQIEIDYTQKWHNVHWRTIQAAYGRAPYFEFYSDYLREVYERQPLLADHRGGRGWESS